MKRDSIPQPVGLDAPRWPGDGTDLSSEWIGRISALLRGYADKLESGELVLDGADLSLGSVGGVGKDGYRAYFQSGRTRAAFYLTNPSQRQRAIEGISELTDLEPESFHSDYTMRDAIAADVDRLMTYVGAL